MLSTFHARISECFVKWITPPSPPPPSLKKLYFTTARKGSWKHDKSCVPRDVGVCSEFEGGLGLIFWTGAHSHMLASLQGSKAPLFGPALLPSPYTHLSHFNPLSPSWRAPHLLSFNSGSWFFSSIWFPLNIPWEMMRQEKFHRGGRLWQSGLWRGHLQENKTFLWPHRLHLSHLRTSSEGRLPLEGDVWAIWRNWGGKWRKGIFLGRWNTRIKVLSQEDI